MKKTKKLVIAKETLRNLAEGTLEKVVGASDTSFRMCAGSFCLNCNTAYDCPPTSNSMYC